MLAMVRQAAVRLRDLMHQAVHPYRHRRVRSLIARERPRRLLFICLGNVCRSPYAECSAAQRVERLRAEGLTIRSAGFIGPGRHPPAEALRVARRRGIDTSEHVSRTVTREMVNEADAIFVFDRFNVARLRKLPGIQVRRLFWLGDFDPVWSGKRAIIDPWGKSVEVFDQTFDRIDRCVDEVLAAILRPEDSAPN